MTRERIHWSDRIEEADWIVEQLSDDLAAVAWLVPRSLECVVELVHGDPDAVGSLPVTDARLLVDVLRRHTSTSGGCWFGVSAEFGWNGHDPIGGEVFECEDSELGPDADMPVASSQRGRITRSSYDHPMVRAPARSFMLYRGPIEGAFWIAQRYRWEQIPNLWWPDDRIWCVRTDIDLASTYVAGSDPLIQDLLAEPGLSVRRADPNGPYPARLLPRPNP